MTSGAIPNIPIAFADNADLLAKQIAILREEKEQWRIKEQFYKDEIEQTTRYWVNTQMELDLVRKEMNENKQSHSANNNLMNKKRKVGNTSFAFEVDPTTHTVVETTAVAPAPKKKRSSNRAKPVSYIQHMVICRLSCSSLKTEEQVRQQSEDKEKEEQDQRRAVCKQQTEQFFPDCSTSLQVSGTSAASYSC